MTLPARRLRFASVVTLMAGLTGFGCGQGLVGDENAASLSTLGGRMGVDYSWARPSPSGLRASGYTFASRYVSDDSGKNISRSEADSLKAAGVDVVANWEDDGHAEILAGYNRGVQDAERAQAQALAAGMPSTRPIFFSIDFDAASSQQAAVNSFFDGVAAVIGRNRTGAYGGYGVINRLFNDGKISYGWQTYAWSGGNWDGRAQVRQIQNGAACSGGCDVDEAISTDFGEWGASGSSVGSSSVKEIAFQANTSSLWTVGSEGNTDWHLGMMPGTSPSITALEGGGFQVAFQANTGNLWTVGSAGNRDWGLGMMNGTSPAITALQGGGFQVAFEANTGNLWTAGSAGIADWHLGMMVGSSPAIAGLSGGGYQVAFEANTTALWTVGTAGNRDTGLGMMKGTNPAIAALTGGGYEIAFEANTTSLWTIGSAGDRDWALGMYSGTSPAITGLTGGGYQVAFEANTTSLWTVGTAGMRDWQLGMLPGTNPTIGPEANDGFRAAFQANTTSLWTADSATQGAWGLGMLPGTSPSST